MIKNSMDLNDETVTSSMLSSTKEAIYIYLNATLTSSTPELRSIYSASLGQMIAGHTALTDLSVIRDGLILIMRLPNSCPILIMNQKIEFSLSSSVSERLNPFVVR